MKTKQEKQEKPKTTEHLFIKMLLKSVFGNVFDNVIVTNENVIFDVYPKVDTKKHFAVKFHQSIKDFIKNLETIKRGL